MNIHYPSFLRLTILIIASAAHHAACTVPSAAMEVANSSPSDRTKAKRGVNDGVGARAGVESSADEAVHHDKHPPAVKPFLGLLSLSRYSMWAIVFLDGTSRILSILPVSRISRTLLPILLPGSANSGPNASYAPMPLLTSPPQLTFAISATTIMFGWRIRKACFDALGKHFTFTHTTLRKHSLVSDGPYSVVRHPGYVGMLLVRLGGLCMLLAQGGWACTVGAVPWPLSRVMAHRVSDSVDSSLVRVAKLVIGVYALHTIFEQIALFGVRAPREDTTLRERFGGEWRAYRERVPWMFVPHVM